jgi:hypothetical protein
MAADLATNHDLEGFTWRGVTVTNPFAATRHVLLGALLGKAEREQGHLEKE